MRQRFSTEDVLVRQEGVVIRLCLNHSSGSELGVYGGGGVGGASSMRDWSAGAGERGGECSSGRLSVAGWLVSWLAGSVVCMLTVPASTMNRPFPITSMYSNTSLPSESPFDQPHWGSLYKTSAYHVRHMPDTLSQWMERASFTWRVCFIH